ncbi:hypothetical protein Clacol_007562 [Clathrus columnatus]|uniref:PH domain-containing protein n=1 Tax=Clathrus columnatus TaxID=1419009 RepID=A0AAV5AKA9_9AGAM|nr:hypothetical protein Clacol_007562 [Clathrus columnatus]
MTDVLTSKQRRSSMPYFTIPFSLFRRHLPSQAHPPKKSPASLNSTNNDEVIEIGPSTSISTQHTFSHPDEPLLTTPEDEERQRLRDAAAQSLGLNLNAVHDNDNDSARHSYSSPSRPQSKSPATVPHGYETTGSSSSHHILSSFPVDLPPPPAHTPGQPLVTTAKLPAYPCSYSDLAPFIQISSSYLKFTTPANKHSSNGLALISLPKRSKSVKPYWKVCYVVLSAPREYGHRGLLSRGYSLPTQSPSSPYNNFHSLASPNTRLELTNSSPSTSSSFTPSHSHLHIFQSEHPTREEMEIDRLEINEDSVVYIADIELAGKKGLIKVTGRHVGASDAANDEELGRTLWILKYPEIKNEALSKRVIYPDESEIQQRWVKEIKSLVLSQRAERAGFLHASSQPTSSLLGNPGFSLSANNTWHLPISPNRQSSFFPQVRPSQPVLPPPNPNPRYAEHVGAAPSSASNTHPSVHHLSRSQPPPSIKTTGLRSLFRSPSPSTVSKDDALGIVKYRATPSMRSASRPSSRDGSVSVWSGVSHGIRGTTIQEEGEKDIEPSQHKDIHPMAPDESMEDYASFLTRLNTRFKESLKVKGKEKGKKSKKRPNSTGAMPDDRSDASNVDAFVVSNRDERNSFVSSQLHHFVRRPVSPVNEMSVASIYSQSSVQEHTKEQDPRLKGAIIGTIGAPFPSGEDENVAEWILSTTHAQAEGGMQNDAIPAFGDKAVHHQRRRPNDRLSIGESLAISLSMNPPSRDRRRSTTISALAVPALNKEDWVSPQTNGFIAVSDDAENPNLAYPYGSEPRFASSDTSRPVSTSTQDLSTLTPASSRVTPPVSLAPSVPPSARNSIEIKRSDSRSYRFTRGTGTGDATISGTILKIAEELESGNTSKSEMTTDDDDAYTYHGGEYLTPRAAPSDLLRSSSQLKSIRSAFGHRSPPIYKRVSAPPAPLSATNSSNGLPPLRPPFLCPPPPHPVSLRIVDDKNNGEKFNKITNDGNENTNRPMTSQFPRLSLNPSLPPPFPPRPDEIVTLVTTDVHLINGTAHLNRQQQRPHSTSAGPRQKHQKTPIVADNGMDGNERRSFMSMYPMSVLSMIPKGNYDSKHGDYMTTSTPTTVPAPQPPPQGPLPPTPGFNPTERQVPGSPKGPRRPSITRRSRITSLPPALRADGSNDTETKGTDITNLSLYTEMTEVTRPRPFIPAPPKMRPPKPQESSLERMSITPVCGNPPAEYGPSPDFKTSQNMFLQMHDSPRTSIHLPVLDQAILSTAETSGVGNNIDEDHHLIDYSHHNHSETLVVPDAQGSGPTFSPPPRRKSRNSKDLRRTSGASAVSQGFQEIPTPKESGSVLEDSKDLIASPEPTPSLVPNDSEPNDRDVGHENESNVAEVNFGSGVIGMGRITPPPPSPLPITPSRTSSPSQLSRYSVPSYFQYEQSAESEGEGDFDY